jgi:molybdopterin-guanine dinucleotide biosynthesis protein
MHGVHGNRNQNSGVRLDERNFGRIELHFHENASFFEANTELDILIADYIDNMSLTVVENHKKNKTYYAISAYDEKNYNLIKIDRRIFDFLNKIEELKKAEKIYQYDVRIKKEKFVEVINTLIDENILLAIEG